MYFFAYFAARVLSKKAIAEMTAYEMVGVIILSTVAAEPLVTKVTAQAIVGTGILVLLTFLTAKLALRNRLTRFLEHTPSMLIKDGKIEWDALKRNNLSVNLFYGMLRQKGYTKVGDLVYVILEPEGKLSVFPKPEKRPLQPGDMQIVPPYEGIAYPVVVEGKIVKSSLEFINQTETWLLEQLKKQGIHEWNEIALAELDAAGNLLVTTKLSS